MNDLPFRYHRPIVNNYREGRNAENAEECRRIKLPGNLRRRGRYGSSSNQPHIAKSPGNLQGTEETEDVFKGTHLHPRHGRYGSSSSCRILRIPREISKALKMRKMFLVACSSIHGTEDMVVLSIATSCKDSRFLTLRSQRPPRFKKGAVCKPASDPPDLSKPLLIISVLSGLHSCRRPRVFCKMINRILAFFLRTSKTRLFFAR